MSMPMGSSSDPSHNVTNLPLSDPLCNSDLCLAFKAAHAESQAAVSYYQQYEYGHYTTWYYLTVVGVAMVIYAGRLYRNCRPPELTSRPRKTTVTQKAVALLRIVSYTHAKGRVADNLRLPSLGRAVFLAFTWLFLLLLTFLIRPYYRERRGFGSPPLAVRTGLMSQALTPLIVALAGKVNFISFLTGIGHQKLNYLHRWASYMCLFLAIVHTVPFIYQPLHQPFGGPAALHKQYYKPGGYEYTGTPALGMLVGLVVLSVPWIRSRYYNLFYRIHIPMYVAYLGLLFWHSADQQDSWAYLWATLAIWLTSVLVRLFYKWQTFSVFRTWFSGWDATLEELPGGLTRVTILAPADFRWRTGQHCWLRIPHLSLLQNHPFTISNLAKEHRLDPDDKGKDDPQEIVIYVRAHAGFSRDLLNSVRDKPQRSVRVHFDGPYDGLKDDLPRIYEEVIFVAGGSGIAGCLPWIEYCSRSIEKGSMMVRQVHVLWIVKDSGHFSWASRELEEYARIAGGSVRCHLYVTDQSRSGNRGNLRKPESGRLIEENKEAGGFGKSRQTDGGLNAVADSGPLVGVKYQRPYLPRLLPSLISRRRVAIFGCGPESMKTDLHNTAAAAQSRVLGGGADTVWLYMEGFGW